MKYDPKDANPPLIPDGKYYATIKAVYDEDANGAPLRSKSSGEEMQKVIFDVWANPNKPSTLHCYFTAKSSLFRYRQLAHALGQKEAFSAKTFDAKNHIGESLDVEIETQENEQYGDQNNIKAFSIAEGANGKPLVDRSHRPKCADEPDSKPADPDVPF